MDGAIKFHFHKGLNLSYFHPAHKIPFEELYSGLLAEANLGYIDIIKDGNLELFNYTRQTTYDKHWNMFTLMARGLVLDVRHKIIAATSFPKFFNLSELTEKLPDLPFTVTDKHDGSLGIVFYHNGQWRVVTRGSFTSSQAIWATNYLHANMPKLNPIFTYLVEIIYKQNRIVVNYHGWEGLSLLGIYSNFDGQEIVDGELWELSQVFLTQELSGKYLVQIPKQHSIEELLHMAKTHDANHEGWVIRFENGLRVKIKTDEYCRLHRLISSVTPLTIWEMMVKDDNLMNIKQQLPEEFYNDFDTIVNILTQQYTEIYNKNTEIFKDIYYENRPRKAFAENIKDLWGVPHMIPSVLFSMYDKKSESYIKKNILKYIRPIGNVLQGWEPSSSMMKFVDMEA